jgi:hypothetical protein
MPRGSFSGDFSSRFSGNFSLSGVAKPAKALRAPGQRIGPNRKLDPIASDGGTGNRSWGFANETIRSFILKAVGASGITQPDNVYLEARILRKHVSTIELWGFCVGVVICGEFNGWQVYFEVVFFE